MQENCTNSSNRTNSQRACKLFKYSGIFLKQIAEACDAYLPAAAKESLLFAANKQPYRSIPRANSDEQIAKELQENPMEAEAHMAAEM